MLSALKKLFSPRDLTQGDCLKGLAAFSLPLILGNIAQQLYNTVDTIVVGNYVGDAALGAVGLAGTVMTVILVLISGISAGASIVAAQYFGARDRIKLGQTVGTTITITVLAGLIMTAIGLVIVRPLLQLMGTSEAMMDYAVRYLTIIVCGLVSNGLYNILSAVIRGMGDSTSPLLYLLVASLLNVALDLFFILYTPMDTDGVALATVIAQTVSAGLCIRRLLRMKDAFDMERKSLIPDSSITKRVIRLGLPSGLTQMLFSVSAMLVQGLAVSIGDTLVTANNIINRLEGFVMLPSFAFSSAATTFTGQNVGAAKKERVEQGAKSSVFLSVCTSLIVVICLEIFSPALTRIFTQTEEIVVLCTKIMRIMGAAYIIFGVTQALHGVMRGAGETYIPMLITVVGTLVIRMPSAYLFAYLTRTAEYPNGNPVVLACSAALCWAFTFTWTLIAYKRRRWVRHLPWYEPKTQGGN